MAGTIARTGETFPSTLGSTRYSIILPEDYDEPAVAGRRYPVVYLLLNGR